VKDENDNKTIDWVVETELGTEKLCRDCQDYYPMTKEFFFGRNSKSGFKFDPICKACYKEKYGRSLIRTNNVEHRYRVVA
jgi:hypothetical protein